MLQVPPPLALSSQHHGGAAGAVEDGEWVSTSSESGDGSPSLDHHGDHGVDDGNLSDGELELSEAVISVNQYVVQPRHYDAANVTSSSCNFLFFASKT